MTFTRRRLPPAAGTIESKGLSRVSSQLITVLKMHVFCTLVTSKRSPYLSLLKLAQVEEKPLKTPANCRSSQLNLDDLLHSPVNIPDVADFQSSHTIDQLVPMSLSSFLCRMTDHHDHIYTCLEPSSVSLRNDDLVQQDPTVSLLQGWLQVRKNLPTLLVWPVVKHHLQIVHSSIANVLWREKVMLESFNAHLFQFPDCSGRLDRFWKVLEYQTPGHVRMMRSKTDEIVTAAATDIYQEGIVFGGLVFSKHTVHDVRHLMPLQPERFEAHVVVKGFCFELSTWAADVLEVMVVGVRSKLPSRVIFVRWVLVVLRFEVLWKAVDIDLLADDLARTECI
jgi:hypothetical protein